jgi:cardiolipin synthase A/B
MDWQQLANTMQGYLPHLVLAVSVLASVLATIHIAMTKQDVKSAIGWVAVVIFSPLLGATFYLFAGINRIRQQRLSAQREMASHELAVMDRLIALDLTDYADPYLDALRTLGNNVCKNELLIGNRVEILDSGDETYPAMIEAIALARQCIALQSYIFDQDAIGVKIAQALIDAHNRGVQVRVLIDAVGAKYSSPPITRLLKASGVPVARFLPTAIGMRLVYANLRSHRKLLVVDGSLALAGGMNIRAGFMTAFAGDKRANDTHFKVTGPIARQLMNSFAHDWEFTTRESLPTTPWFEFTPHAQSGDDVTPARVVTSGPDRTMGSNLSMILGALSVARYHVRIQSPYFLPDLVLIAALVTAARRGVTVDVLIPGHNNLKLVGAAMEAQLEMLIKEGVRVWRTGGAFDHSKLLTIDNQWSYVGSSNIDPRSLRLNFELDLEVYSRALANQLSQRIDSKIAHGKLVTLSELRAVSFLVRLRNRLIWLVSPYL